MATFFTDQLDYILFFYGLAFILLGAVAVAVSRGPQQSIPWSMLAAFGYVHGAGEWADLLALILGDTSAFVLARTAFMTLSFVALVEFGRLDAVRHGWRMPGRWIYLATLALVVLGWHLAGAPGANAFARYFLAFPAGVLVCVMLATHARKAPRPEKRWLAGAAVGFGLYALAAGVIVPSAPNWSGDLVTHEIFFALTGIPIQFVRGLLACFISLCIWGYWVRRLVVDADSVRYAQFQQRQFVWTLAALGAILVAGWFLTEVLGGVYRNNVEEEAAGDLNLIASRLAGETATTEGMVKALAGSRSVGELVAGNPKADRGRVEDILMLETDASGASEGFILDARGKVLIASARASGAGSAIVGQDFSQTPFFKASRTGDPGYHYAIESGQRTPNYYVSYPIRTVANHVAGEVIGVAVLKRPLSRFEIDLQGFDRSFALVDRDGIVVLTNRPEVRLRAVWRVSPETRALLSDFYGSIDATPLMKREITGSAWTVFDGDRDFVQRRNLEHGDWSLVTWKVPQGIFASRVLGIIITLQMAILALVYLVGRERWMHDNVQLEKRFELEELARTLDNRAATDPLTGLYNRRKFDRSLAAEISRAQRYETQLALMLFDIDHFKTVNDTYGHPVGDTVLIALSRYTSSRIRGSDVLARWGGEEFVVLMPGTSGPMACLLAGNLLAGIGGLQIPEVGRVTCSFGVTEYVAGDTADSLLARADEALYQAKSNGRNRIELAAPPVPQGPTLVPAAAPDDVPAPMGG